MPSAAHPCTLGRSPTQQQSPGRAQGEYQLGGALTPRKFWISEPPWPNTGSILESCFQRNLTLSAL